jgi:hypothetical protein
MKIWNFLLFLLVINMAYAESIGVTPEKTVIVDVGVPTDAYFSVSQGSERDEQITIEGIYDWLDIEEREFILGSKTGKPIKYTITTDKYGEYKAELRVCGHTIGSEGEVLSAKVCTTHKLKVISNGKNKRGLVIPLIFVAIIIGAYFFFRIIKDDFCRTHNHPVFCTCKFKRRKKRKK